MKKFLQSIIQLLFFTEIRLWHKPNNKQSNIESNCFQEPLSIEEEFLLKCFDNKLQSELIHIEKDAQIKLLRLRHISIQNYKKVIIPDNLILEIIYPEEAKILIPSSYISNLDDIEKYVKLESEFLLERMICTRVAYILYQI